MSESLLRAPVYDSLQRRPQLLGLPQEAFLLLALLMVCMAIASRLDPLVVGGCALVFLVLLPILRRLFENEPYLMDILPRALRYNAYYPHQAKEQSQMWMDRVGGRFG